MKTWKWIPILLVGLFCVTGSALAIHRTRVVAVTYRSPVVHRTYVRPVVGLNRVTVPVRYGPAVVRVAPVNYGEVDFNIEPQNSQVFVDGHYLGVADEFNGFPQTAKLPSGYHQVRAVAPDGRVIERRIYVAAGQELNFDWRF